MFIGSYRHTPLYINQTPLTLVFIMLFLLLLLLVSRTRTGKCLTLNNSQLCYFFNFPIFKCNDAHTICKISRTFIGAYKQSNHGDF